MAHVQAPRGAVAREHGVFLWVHGQIGLDLVADLLGGEEGVARQIACHGGGSSLSRAPFRGAASALKAREEPPNGGIVNMLV